MRSEDDSRREVRRRYMSRSEKMRRKKMRVPDRRREVKRRDETSAELALNHRVTATIPLLQNAIKLMLVCMSFFVLFHKYLSY